MLLMSPGRPWDLESEQVAPNVSEVLKLVVVGIAKLVREVLQRLSVSLDLGFGCFCPLAP